MEARTAHNHMTIGQICHGNLGGSSRVAGRLANALCRRSHGVEMFSYQPLPWSLFEDIAVHTRAAARHDESEPLYWDWTEYDRKAFARMLTQRLNEQQFDVLHYHYAQPFAGILRQVAAELGDRMPATIGTLHGTDLTRCFSDPATLETLKRDLSGTDIVTTASTYMSELLLSLLPDGPAPRILPNFVEDIWPQTDDRHDQPLSPPAKPVMLHVSNFRTVKDVTLLAKLFIEIHRRIDVELWLVGDGPDLPALRHLLDRSPAKNAIRHLGVHANPAALFRQSSFLLSTSAEEGFGLTVLEAMASGAVVVATAVGGVPELVTDDVTGILFAPHDLEATAARIEALLEAPGSLDGMRTAALSEADRLRETRVIGYYENLYRECLVPCAVSLAD